MAAMEMAPFYRWLDPYLIWFYRITGQAAVDFILGTMVLALVAMLVGEITLSLAYRAVRKHIEKMQAEAARYQELSMEALAEGDKGAYRAANRLANDAFGRSFFMQIGLSAAFLWPVFFALAWMEYRFASLEFPLPLTSHSLGYVGAFILLYALTYLLLKWLIRKLARFRSTRPAWMLRAGRPGA